MATFVIMERRGADGQDAEPIRDGLAVLALLFPLPWLLWHRLWLESLLYLVLAFALIGIGWLAGMGDNAGLLALPLNILAGLEGPTLRQAALRRRGWDEWGSVEAADEREALLRHLAEAGHMDARIEARPAIPMRYTQAAGPALGLFAYPDRR
jgi:hypothetical protein